MQRRAARGGRGFLVRVDHLLDVLAVLYLAPDPTVAA